MCASAACMRMCGRPAMHLLPYACRTRRRWVQGDAMELPFGPCTFHAATMGYGLRNVVSIPSALQELHRVLKPGAAATAEAQCTSCTHPCTCAQCTRVRTARRGAHACSHSARTLVLLSGGKAAILDFNNSPNPMVDSVQVLAAAAAAAVVHWFGCTGGAQHAGSPWPHTPACPHEEGHACTPCKAHSQHAQRPCCLCASRPSSWSAWSSPQRGSMASRLSTNTCGPPSSSSPQARAAAACCVRASTRQLGGGAGRGLPGPVWQRALLR